MQNPMEMIEVDREDDPLLSTKHSLKDRLRVHQVADLTFIAIQRGNPVEVADWLERLRMATQG